MLRRNNLDPNLAEFCASLLFRYESEHVLLTEIARDASGRVHDCRARTGKKSNATGIFAKRLENPGVFLLTKLIEQTN